MENSENNEPIKMDSVEKENELQNQDLQQDVSEGKPAAEEAESTALDNDKVAPEPKNQDVDEAKLDAEPKSEPEVEAEPEPEVKLEAKPEVKPETEPELEVKSEEKLEVKPETKPEVEAEAKPEVKAEAEPEVKPENKDVKEVEDKPEDKSEAQEEEEQINFALLSKEDLVNVLEDLLNTQSFDKIKASLEEIRSLYYEKRDKETAELKVKFLADGGLEQDFKPVDEPTDSKLNELISKYKYLKADHNKQMEADKDANLKIKQEVLEELRLLMDGQESFDNTFRKFKQLQKRWFDVGLVPQKNVKDLWNSYNYFVDKFNDYVKINRELRILDLKKNFELKEKLCERAEELAKEENVATAFKTLQKFHSQWREIGPVPRESKDILWERFKAATSVINKVHQKYQSDIKGSLVKNLELKEQLCAKAEEMSTLKLTAHMQWSEKTNELLALQEEWKTIGYAPKKDNNLIYARFRKACDLFFERKAAFYAENFEQQRENQQKKMKIIEQAEELKDSEEWKSGTEKFIDLQRRWKTIGPVPRKESDRMWKKFRNACDHFFNKKSEFYSGKESSYDENLKEKEAIIEEMKSYKASGDKKQVLADLEDIQKRFMDIGFVPVEKKDIIREAFKDSYYQVIDQLDISDFEKSLIRYRNRISSILSNPRSENKIRFERDKLMNKLQQSRTDIGVWENNIGFFKQTKNAEETLSEFQVKIEESKQRITLLERKIRIIDELDD